MNDLDDTVSLRAAAHSTTLDELLLSCSTDVATVRHAVPGAVGHRIELLPGDICERWAPLGTLRTTEFCTHTVAGIADRPIMVGSLFLLRFDPETLDVPSALAVCERCVMLTETSFELRLRFAHPLTPADSGA